MKLMMAVLQDMGYDRIKQLSKDLIKGCIEKSRLPVGLTIQAALFIIWISHILLSLETITS